MKIKAYGRKESRKIHKLVHKILKSYRELDTTNKLLYKLSHKRITDKTEDEHRDAVEKQRLLKERIQYLETNLKRRLR